MKRECRIALLALFLIWMSPAPVRCADNPSEPDAEPTAEELRAFSQAVQRRLLLQNGQFLLSGEVLDEKGKRLSAVKLTLEKLKRKGPMERSGEEREVQTVEGTFRLDLKGYGSVRLQFEKEGYEPVSMEFSIRPTTEQERKVMAPNEPLQPIELKKEDLRVVLKAAAGSTPH